MIKLSGNLDKALSTIPKSNKYLELDLSDCITEYEIFDMNFFISKFRNRIVSLILPDTIKEIISKFLNFEIKKLNKISGRNVIKIGNFAFEHYDLLESIDFPKVTSIGKAAFIHCRSLESITLPNVTNMGNCAFQGCMSLTSIDLPKMHEVNDTVFNNCDSLKTVNLFINLINECMPEVCNELYD